MSLDDVVGSRAFLVHGENTMEPELVSKGSALVRAVALGVVTMVVVGYGCGSGEPEVKGVPGVSKVIDYDKAYYRYEGTGKNKTKVALTRREKRAVQVEAGKKLQEQAEKKPDDQ